MENTPKCSLLTREVDETEVRLPLLLVHEFFRQRLELVRALMETPFNVLFWL